MKSGRNPKEVIRRNGWLTSRSKLDTAAEIFAATLAPPSGPMSKLKVHHVRSMDLLNNFSEDSMPTYCVILGTFPSKVLPLRFSNHRSSKDLRVLKALTESSPRTLLQNERILMESTV